MCFLICAFYAINVYKYELSYTRGWYFYLSRTTGLDLYDFLTGPTSFCGLCEFVEVCVIYRRSSSIGSKFWLLLISSILSCKNCITLLVSAHHSGAYDIYIYALACSKVSWLVGSSDLRILTSFRRLLEVRSRVQNRYGKTVICATGCAEGFARCSANLQICECLICWVIYNLILFILILFNLILANL